MHRIYTLTLAFLVSTGATISLRAEPIAVVATRTLAANEDVSKNSQLPLSLETDFIQKVILESQENAKKFQLNNELRRAARTEAERVEKVSTDTHTEIIPEYSEQGLTFRLRYDSAALKAPQHLLKDLALISILSSVSNTFSFSSAYWKGKVDASAISEIESAYSIAELISNANAGSLTAKARWVSLQTLLLKNIEVNAAMTPGLQLKEDAIQQVRAEMQNQLPMLETSAIQRARKQQKALETWRKETGTLDKLEAMTDKLDDLLMKNDRKGVRQLLEAYLPWAVMEPVEANTWKIWLEAIEHPDLKNTTVAFRGLKYDTDKIQRRQTMQGEVYGFMSTVLTKNQGSYTRRLRSLSTNRVKNGDKKESTESRILSVRVIEQMIKHATDPVASSFISFTYDPNVAFNFMGENKIKQIKGELAPVPYGGLLVVKMDSRRMIPNTASMYSSEIELLAPLLVFPDEVVAYKEGAFDQTYTFKMFIKDISTKTGINFTSWSTSNASSDVVSLKERYTRDGHFFLKQMTDINSAKSCSKVF